MMDGPRPERQEPVLEIGARSFEMRHSVPPIAWVCFEDIALAARRDASGELSLATGVRELALQLGVTKNTAARAVAALVEAGVLRRSQVLGEKGRVRSGYAVLLIDGVRLSCPVDAGTCTGKEDTDTCTGNRDTARRNEKEDSNQCPIAHGGAGCLDPRDKHPCSANGDNCGAEGDPFVRTKQGSSPRPTLGSEQPRQATKRRNRRRRLGRDENQLTFFDATLDPSADVESIAEF